LLNVNWKRQQFAFLMAGRQSVQILAHFIDLAAQVAALVRGQAAGAAAHFGIVAGFLHGAALLFRARLVAARIDLALGLGRTLLLLSTLLVGTLLHVALRIALHFTRRRLVAAAAVTLVGAGQAGAQQSAAHRQRTHGKTHAQSRGIVSVKLFVMVRHGVP
jgi:hypothetical protein